MCVRDLTRVPRCFPMMDTLSTWSGTSNILRCHSMRQLTQLHILLRCQSSRAVVSRSFAHAFQFPCKMKEGKRGRHCVSSRWVVSGGGK